MASEPPTEPEISDEPTNMVDYLSGQWIAAADAAVAGIAPLSDDVVVGFIITDPAADTSYSLVLGPDRVGVESGVGQAGVTLTLGRTTAVSIARGEMSAQRAFLEGIMTIGGDISLILGHSAAIGAIDDRLGALRTMTRF